MVPRSACSTKFAIDQASLVQLESAGWPVHCGADISQGDRVSCSQVVVAERLNDTIARLNPALPIEAVDYTFRKPMHPKGADLFARDRAQRRLLVSGIAVVEWRVAP